MKFNVKLLEGEWCKYNDELELLIRPFPNSKQPIKMSSDITMGEFNFALFSACVLDWRGVEDSEGNIMKCTLDNKLKIFDLDSNLFLFVFEKQASIKAQQEVEVKN